MVQDPEALNEIEMRRESVELQNIGLVPAPLARGAAVDRAAWVWLT